MFKRAQVGDYEHVWIVKYRLELTGKRKSEPISMDNMAKKLGRSSGTVCKHINYHNNMVHSVGECDKCDRVNAQTKKVAVD